MFLRTCSSMHFCFHTHVGPTSLLSVATIVDYVYIQFTVISSKESIERSRCDHQQHCGMLQCNAIRRSVRRAAACCTLPVLMKHTQTWPARRSRSTGWPLCWWSLLAGQCLDRHQSSHSYYRPSVCSAQSSLHIAVTPHDPWIWTRPFSLSVCVSPSTSDESRVSIQCQVAVTNAVFASLGV